MANKEQETPMENDKGPPQPEEKEMHKSLTIRVNRPAYTQAEFDEVLEPSQKQRKTIKERIKNTCSKCACSGSCVKKTVKKAFPFLQILQGYSLKDDFVNDLVSGLTVGVMHIPQGKLPITYWK